MKDIKTAEEFYDTTNYEVELWDAEQQKNGVSCNQLMRFAQQYAEYYHKAKVESISDEEIEDTIHMHIPFAVKNRNGNLTNPIKSQKMYTSILKSVTKGVRQLLENKLLNDL